MRKFIVLLFSFFIPLASAQLSHSNDPKLEIDFWRKNYTEVTSGHEYDLAHSVFNKIIAVADKPVGVLPTLCIFSNLKLNQLFATQDGRIVLPLKVLQFCQKEKRCAEARLAFLLGHEVKHIVRGDYEKIKLLIKFIENMKDHETPEDFGLMLDRASWISSLQQRRSIETQADEYGILYASLAGFDVRAIISSDHNFISDFYQFAKVNLHGDLSHPSAEERFSATRQRIVSILNNLVLFECGLRFCVIGEYDAAIELLTEFVRLFPSREVFNNRGICYYQKALSLFAKWKPDEMENDPHFIFKPSAQIDPVSRASVTTRAIQPQYEQKVLEAINNAIADFKEAERLDTQYSVVYNNLGCVHLLKGELEFAKGYFKKAIEINPSYREAHNNLGICYVVDEDGEKAKNSFLDASRIDPTYPDPFYNLGQLYSIVGSNDEAKRYFERYLQLDENSGFATKARTLLGMPMLRHTPPDFREKIGNMTPQNISPYGDQWRILHTTQSRIFVFHEEKQQIGFCYYKRNNIISLVWSDNGYQEQTAKSIRIGDPDELVKIRYPFRRRKVPTTTGSFWVYKDLGLVFEMRYGKVYRWFLYDVM